MPPTPLPAPARTWRERAEPLLDASLRGFHRYASWLVSISWWRFLLLSILLMIVVSITQSLPLFRYTVVEWVDEPVEPPEEADEPSAPQPERPPRKPLIKIEKPRGGASGSSEGVDISIDEDGIRIRPRAAPAAASSPASAPVPAPPATPSPPSEADRKVDEAVRQAEQAAREAAAAAKAAAAESKRAAKEAGLQGATRRVEHRRTVHWGSFLTDLALIWIFASAIVKITYKGRLQAEVKAARATETAEAESLKRQVVEARMAAMQAQIEPHFLFNTLASIDHLIETDPRRASQMQKNLIALLRASMPTMREAQDSGAPRDLARELAVIRPYLQILEARMEERLATEIDVPDGLLSAEFPPMMIQTLVENAIKHGLEPKPEGGSLRIKAEIVHGKLAVSVSDTGMGFGKAPTAGTGVGLANIRERLQLAYGARASLALTENAAGGTTATITVPYRALDEGGRA